MIWTHVYIRCVGWTWRLLTRTQWLALPHFKAATIICGGAAAIALPPAQITDYVPRPSHEGSWRPAGDLPPEYYIPGAHPIDMVPGARRIVRRPVTTPEPGTLMVVLVGIGGVLVARSRKPIDPPAS